MFQPTLALSSSCFLLPPPVNRIIHSGDDDGIRYGTYCQWGLVKRKYRNARSSQNGGRMVSSVTGKHCRGSSDGKNTEKLDRTQHSVMVAPLAASMAVLLWSCPVQAEMLLGFSGLKSIPSPELPNFDFLERIQEENRKKYEANDSKFKSSALLQELLKRSKANAERHKQEIQDKYCLRGAEMGVGDCSTIGMSREESEAFIEMLRKKVADN